ncbi:hypothetical protein SAMD00023353_3400460 [Rosellinia necatrix]|uniref:DUF7907 domain-containing protein n=1 Tax=Rosellinia necatrix TaxID=77044 RepID=A0A1W2TKZ2_ROSNE|nr:hypothetical protein SAMD00023353_3400460 [Rosellinia necatrix]
MRSFVASTLTLALASAVLAAPAPSSPAAAAAATSAKFQLRAFSDAGLTGWALVNAHAGAATNSVQIQRPSAYQSDVSHLDGTSLVFDLNSVFTPYTLRVPAVPAGAVAHVTVQVGQGTEGFALTADNHLSFNGAVSGWWACPVNNTFELFYGPNPDPANLPSTECQAIELVAGFV